MARTQNSKVIFMPTEVSGVLSSVGAFKEIFAETGEKSELPTGQQRPPRELDR
jgi:hypothetical protein